MSPQRKQDPFEKKVEAMSRGFSTFPIPNAQLRFRREDLTPAQVMARLQGIVEVIQAVRETEAHHRAAVKACAKAMPKDHAFYEEAIEVLKSHFGSDAKIMATFGLKAHTKSRGRTPEVVIVEVARPERAPEVVVEQQVEVDRRDAERVEVETRVEEPKRRPRQPVRHRPGRGTRR